MNLREFAVDTEAFGRITGLRGGPSGAPKVLALHGWLDNAASFVPLSAHLLGIELVALDMIGHGASAHLPLAAEYTMPNYARAAFAVADALGWERFALLGHSLGGATCSVMAAACPQRITRAVFIDGIGAMPEREARTATRLRESFAEQAAPAGRTLRVFSDIVTAVRARMQSNALTEASARLLVERGIAPVQTAEGPGGYIWRSDPRLTRTTAIRMSELQIQNLLANIECPARVIYADPALPFFPDAVRRERAALLPHGELVVRAGGHHLHMDDAEGVAAVMGDFLIAG